MEWGRVSIFPAEKIVAGCHKSASRDDRRNSDKERGVRSELLCVENANLRKGGRQRNRGKNEAINKR